MRTTKSRKALLTGPIADEMAYRCQRMLCVCSRMHACVNGLAPTMHTLSGGVGRDILHWRKQWVGGARGCPEVVTITLRMRRMFSSLLKMRTTRRMRMRRSTLRPDPLPPLSTYPASYMDMPTMIKSNQFHALAKNGVHQWAAMLTASSTE